MCCCCLLLLFSFQLEDSEKSNVSHFSHLKMSVIQILFIIHNSFHIMLYTSGILLRQKRSNRFSVPLVVFQIKIDTISIASKFNGMAEAM